jgi:uncharacterized protein (TIGR02646 family)
VKRVIKNEPKWYTDFIERSRPQGWGEVSQEIGHELRRYMLNEEQHAQCAYTELHLKPETSHIDHFKKRSFFPKATFDWKNLLTCCNSEEYGAKFKDKTVKKAEYQYLLHPAIDNPQAHFSYSMTGEILIGAQDMRAYTTRERFNLNHRSLVEQRKQIAFHIHAMYQQVSVDELVECFGKFESFIKVVYSNLNMMEDE